MSDKSAFPLWVDGEANELGLTRRELFAALILSGNQLVAWEQAGQAAKMAVAQADALIAELDK